MTEIKLTHSRETSLQAPAVESTQIGGGLFQPADRQLNLPEAYRLVTTDRMTELLDQDGSVLGSSEDDILVQLKQRHPCPDPQASFLYRVDFAYDIYGGDTNSQSYRRRYRRHQKARLDGWLVVDKPYTECTDIATLQAMTRSLGPVLITPDTLDMLGGKKTLANLGFVSVARRFDLLQINFNPRRTHRYDYVAACKAYKYRTQTGFPCNAVAAMYSAMRPHSAPAKYPLLAIEQNDSAGCQLVVRLADTLRRLWPEYWKSAAWRTSRASFTVCNRRHRWVGPLSFKGAVAECLPFLHTEESHQDGKLHQRFCRFLRREAKAMGLVIPSKPKPPKKPNRPKKKKRAKT